MSCEARALRRSLKKLQFRGYVWENKSGQIPLYLPAQEVMYLYRTDKNSHASVASSVGLPSDDDIAAATSHFHREVGDALTADALSVFVSCKRTIRYKVKEGESHRHGAQLISIPYHTIATIKMPLANMMKKLGLSNNEPNKILK